MDASPPETSHSNYVFSILGGLGSMLIVLFILFIAYLPNRPAPVDQEVIDARKERLAELRAKERDKTDGYAWANREQGKVRIPVERAMQLAVPRLRDGEDLFAAAESGKPDEVNDNGADAAATDNSEDSGKGANAADNSRG